jgi:hypothetical protein
MRKYISILLLVCSVTVYSQSSISGTLLDQEFNNEPLAFGNVAIKGSTNETNSDINGIYNFENLSPGEYVLVYSFLGYETLEKKVIVSDKKPVEINVLMTARKPSLERVTSTANNDKKNEAKLTSS